MKIDWLADKLTNLSQKTTTCWPRVVVNYWLEAVARSGVIYARIRPKPDLAPLDPIAWNRSLATQIPKAGLLGLQPFAIRLLAHKLVYSGLSSTK